MKVQKKRGRDWASAEHMTGRRAQLSSQQRFLGHATAHAGTTATTTWYCSPLTLSSQQRRRGAIVRSRIVVKRAEHVTLCHMCCTCSVSSPFLLQFRQLNELFHAFSSWQKKRGWERDKHNKDSATLDYIDLDYIIVYIQSFSSAKCTHVTICTQTTIQNTLFTGHFIIEQCRAYWQFST